MGWRAGRAVEFEKSRAEAIQIRSHMAARRHGPLGAVLSAQALQLVHPNYFDSLCDAMSLVAQKPNAIFMGQGVGNPGTTMSDTFRDVPAGQKLEMPVAEDMQMGMAIGMSL